VINSLTKICEVHESTIELSLKASKLRDEHNFSFWDSHIVAHAIDAKSDFLISEDMQDGREINGMVIKNIYLR
jgi:predicted nucleic acid-binding protein